MEFIVKTLHGLEQVLAKQLHEAGAQNVKVLKRAVACEGDQSMLYKISLTVSTALRVLLPFEEFLVHTERDLYRKAKSVEWEKILDVSQTFAIDCVSYASFHEHSKFLALRVKDAIADRFTEQLGKRPDVDVKNPAIRINVHISDKKVTFSLDASGFSLNQRGYRVPGHLSPINEVLAAGMIELSSWTADRDFIDPFCGSGTIAIEAAMKAANIPCNWHVKHFAFMNWKDFDKGAWTDLRGALAKQFKQPSRPIYANDIHANTLDLAKESAKNAGVFEYIQFIKKDFNELKISVNNAVLIGNPPYGERLALEEAVVFYKNIGDSLKQNFQNCEAYILSSNLDAAKHIGLKPNKKTQLFNGKLDCRLYHFELYSGTKRVRKTHEDEVV